MVRIAPVRLAYNPKTLWFDARDLDLRMNDSVVVLTARGLEFGAVSDAVFEATEDQMKRLKSTLKPVKRIATEEDVLRSAELDARGREALPVFKRIAAETVEDMNPVAVEFMFDGDKAVFYFEAEERVDFRELVRKLAAQFRIRVDMKQIGVRDEARMVGGYGHCGQELCCRRLGGEFCPVSIRMAKEQDLSLNPQKISGVCGRLMCCLRYEYDAYKDFKGRAPKRNAKVETPEGLAKVVDLDVPREVVSVQIEGAKAVKVPLVDMETADGAARPNLIGEEAWERANGAADMGSIESSSLMASRLTGFDKLADPTRARGVGASSESRAKERSRSKRRDDVDAVGKAPHTPRKQRPRRSIKLSAEEGAPEQVASDAASRSSRHRGDAGGQAAERARSAGGRSRRKQHASGEGKGRSSAPKRRQEPPASEALARFEGAARPGRKSSELRNRRPERAHRPASDHAGRAQGESGKSAPEGGHRRPRRRSHRTEGPSDGASTG